MPPAQNILNIARGQIGVCENPPGSNSGTPYHAWYGEQGIQWCAVFTCWLFRDSPATLFNVHSAYSGNVLDAGRAAGAEVPIEQVQPGDVVIFKWNASHGITDHIGIVEARLGPTTFQTIEGNSGDCVERKHRTQGPGCLMWFVRPKYSEATPPTPKQEEDDDEVYPASKGQQHARIPAMLGGGKKTYLDITDESYDAKGANVRLSFKRDNGDWCSQDQVRTAAVVAESTLRFEVGGFWKIQDIGGVTVKVEVLSGGPVLVTRKQTL